MLLRDARKYAAELRLGRPPPPPGALKKPAIRSASNARQIPLDRPSLYRWATPPSGLRRHPCRPRETTDGGRSHGLAHSQALARGPSCRIRHSPFSIQIPPNRGIPRQIPAECGSPFAPTCPTPNPQASFEHGHPGPSWLSSSLRPFVLVFQEYHLRPTRT
jgi:hypothetical protein